MQRVIYAIMIYENFNRPTTQRWCENVLFCLGRRPMTLGIMQVSTTKFIHNAESVELGCRKIKESFQEYVKIARDTILEPENLNCAWKKYVRITIRPRIT